MSKTQFFPMELQVKRHDHKQNGVCHKIRITAGQHEGLVGDGVGLLSRYLSETCVNRRVSHAEV